MYVFLLEAKNHKVSQVYGDLYIKQKLNSKLEEGAVNVIIAQVPLIFKSRR